MYARHKDGAKAEEFALRYLRKKGLKLVEQNFRSRQGEIDLIMLDRNTTVFVEVRLRKRSDYVSAVESVSFTKQTRLRRTAEYYLQSKRQSFSADCRFDVFAVEGSFDRFQWIKDAF